MTSKTVVTLDELISMESRHGMYFSGGTRYPASAAYICGVARAAPEVLAGFQQYVREGKIHYFISGGLGRSNGGSDSAQQIAAWVADNFTATTAGGATLYELS